MMKLVCQVCSNKTELKIYPSMKLSRKRQHKFDGFEIKNLINNISRWRDVMNGRRCLDDICMADLEPRILPSWWGILQWLVINLLKLLSSTYIQAHYEIIFLELICKLVGTCIARFGLIYLDCINGSDIAAAAAATGPEAVGTTFLQQN